MVVKLRSCLRCSESLRLKSLILLKLLLGLLLLLSRLELHLLLIKQIRVDSRWVHYGSLGSNRLLLLVRRLLGIKLQVHELLLELLLLHLLALHVKLVHLLLLYLLLMDLLLQELLLLLHLMVVLSHSIMVLRRYSVKAVHSLEVVLFEST